MATGTGQCLDIWTYFSYQSKLYTPKAVLKPHLNHPGQCWVTLASSLNKEKYPNLFMNLFSRKLLSTQLSNKFWYCPWRTVSIVLTFHKHDHLGRYEPSSPTKETHKLTLFCLQWDRHRNGFDENLPFRCLKSYCSVRSWSLMMRASLPEKSATVPE